MSNSIPAQPLFTLRLLSLAYFIQAVGALSVVGSLEAISREWALSASQSAYLITVFGVTFALAAPLLQVALGHLPRRRQVLLGLGLFSTASMLFALAPSYKVLLASRVLMGIGAGFIGPVLGALGSNLVERDQQGSAIAVVLLGLSVAGLAGMPITAWLAHVWGARNLFMGIGLAGLVTALLILWRVPNKVAGERVAFRSMLGLLTDPGSLSALLVVFFVTTGVFSTYAFLTPIIRNDYHGNPADVSLALTVLGVAGVLGNLFVTRAARYLSAVIMLVAGVGLLMADILFMWMAPSQLGWLLAALVLWAFATDIVWPTQQRRMVELRPEQRGIALALTASFLFCGIGLGSAIAGWVYPAYGYAGLLASSLLSLSLALGCLVLSERRALPASADAMA
ncbi:MFS transporter [Stutzerimonas zhaodongensis]|uniref:MFS transporter n=1 Tax=Stutzerimonas TaxID=2901164 RepID=UPI00388E03AB